MTAPVPSPPAVAPWVWAELHCLGRTLDPTRHPFHRRFAAGELDGATLALYASEYDHLVVAVRDAWRYVARAAPSDLRWEARVRAEAQAAQLERWRRFAGACGWGPGTAWHYGEEPLASTVACAAAWAGDGRRPLGAHLVVLHAVEGAESRVGRALGTGLPSSHWLVHDVRVEYFRLGAARGPHHLAAMLRSLAGEDPFALLAAARRAHVAHWSFLDGLEARSACPSS
jgi:pyrroloquinoline quinone (PQQ) biosynthesis protein C